MTEFSKVGHIQYSPFEHYHFWLDKYKPWIFEQLDAKHEHEIISFENTALNNLGQIILKKTVCQGQDSVISGRQNRFCKALGEKLVNCSLHPSLETLLLSFSCSKSTGDWLIDSNYLLAVIHFDGLPHPLIYVERQVPQGTWTTTYLQFFCKKEHLHAIITYLQEIERTVRMIKLYRVDTFDSQEVEPIEWSALTLDPMVDEMVRRDFTSFLTKRDWFLKKRLPYRHGYLFHGPPGNGKTTVIRAMLTQAQLPTYTMKKWFSESAETNFERMFELAAKNDQAIILLEDIDRCFGAQDEKDNAKNAISYSTFLNCLDGVNNADGLILIATANNPKTLDPAILERPGRFDRVVGFPNPTPQLRDEYFMKLSPSFNKEGIAAFLKDAPPMSFAQLKEIYVLAHQIAEADNREDPHEGDLVEAIHRMKKMMSVKTDKVGMR